MNEGIFLKLLLGLIRLIYVKNNLISLVAE